MSFGTGPHPSTVLMIKAMSEVDFTERSVLDFDTGTSVLSILAEKLGARKVYAIDMDDWSIYYARENIKENHCRNILVEKADSFEGSSAFDIILANINKYVIQAHFTNMLLHLKEGGIIVVSGLLETDLLDMEHVTTNNGFKI